MDDLMEGLLKLAMKIDDTTQYAKWFEEKVFPILNEIEKFFQDKIYIVGDYLTFEDFNFAEYLLRLIFVAEIFLKVCLTLL